MLDRLCELSGSSVTLRPDRTDKAELRVCKFGRIICEAPLRYDKCPQSLVGDPARTVGPCGAAVGFGASSSTSAARGGLINGGDRISGVVSACRNLLSSCGLPTVDDALPTAESALPTVEDALPTADAGLPTAEDGGDTAGLCGLLAWSPFA